MKTDENQWANPGQRFQHDCSTAMTMLDANTPLKMAQDPKEEFGSHYGLFWKPHTTVPNSRKRAYTLVCLSICLLAALLLVILYATL